MVHENTVHQGFGIDFQPNLNQLPGVTFSTRFLEGTREVLRILPQAAFDQVR
jgi:hypothetical protein